MKNNRYCPNCISEMQPEKRKLGSVNNFYVCHSCGVRELQSQEQDTAVIKTNETEEKDEYYGESMQDIIIGIFEQD